MGTMFRGALIVSKLGSKKSTVRRLNESEQPVEGQFWLVYQGKRFSLLPGPILIGRSVRCQLVLDDELVSRRHANITISDSGRAVLEDLNSVNGVFVEGRQVNNSYVLTPGEHIVIGRQEIVFNDHTTSPERAGRLAQDRLSAVLDRSRSRTLLGVAGARYDDAQTAPGSALDLLGGVADKALALGRGEEVEKVLEVCLYGILERARGGGCDLDTAKKASYYAIKIAGTMRKAQWVNYVFSLYCSMARPLPRDHVDELYKILRALPGVSAPVLREYLRSLQTNQPGFGPSERFLVQRIAGLLPLITL